MDSGRQNQRVTINKEFDSFDQFIQEYVTNISRSGVFIKTKEPLPIGTEVNLRFTVIMDDIETIEGIGSVVRVESDPPGMGVVFTQLSGYSRDLIEKMNDGETENWLQKFAGSGAGAKASEFDARLYLGLYTRAHERFPHNLSFVEGLLNYYSARDRWDDWRRLMTEYYF